MGTGLANAWQDWLLIGGGWALLAVGGLLLLWALFWDRSRGRKRCPKCWYDMSGAVARQESGRELFTCPECGRVVKGERGLRRTRRRWRGVVVGVIALVGWWGVSAVPRARIEGWTGLIPTPVLALGISWLPGAAPIDRESAGWWHKSTAFETDSLSLFERAARVLVGRVRRGDLGLRGRAWIHDVTLARMEADLERSPPRACWWMRLLLESSSTHQYPRMSREYRGMIAPVFRLPEKLVVGAPVYAEVDGEGFGDLPVRVRITTEWPGCSDVPFPLHTESSREYHEFVSYSTGIPPRIVCLGVVQEGVRHVEITTELLEEDGTAGVFGTRRVAIPITVVPKEEDSLVGVPVDTSPFAGNFSARMFISQGSAIPAQLLSLSVRDYGSMLPGDQTLGARVEVVDEDGTVLYTGACCLWDGADRDFDWGYAGQHHATIRLTPTDKVDENVSVAQVRFICDRALARQNLDCVEYYEGEFELPVSTVRH